MLRKAKNEVFSLTLFSSIAGMPVLDMDEAKREKMGWYSWKIKEYPRTL
jgi:hypothetical protein